MSAAVIDEQMRRNCGSGRPGLDRLRDAAEAGVFDAVVCLAADRLARAYAYQVLILEELARCFGVARGGWVVTT